MYYDLFEKVEEFSEHFEIRWNVGEFLRYAPPSRRSTIKMNIHPCTVSNEGAELHALIDTTPNKKIGVVRAKAFVGSSDIKVRCSPNVTTPWYLYKGDVKAHLDRMGFVYDKVIWQEGTIYQQSIYPISFPLEVILHQNDKGYFGRIEMHPELTGREHSAGKIFFPDVGSRKHVCEGPAIVSRVFERTSTYGFMKCEMKQFDAPSDAMLVKWLLSMQECFNLLDTIVYWEHSIFGSHVRVTDNSTGYTEYVTVNPTTGEAEINHHLGQYVTERSTCINSSRMIASETAFNVICTTQFGITYAQLCSNIQAWQLPSIEYIRKASVAYDPTTSDGIDVRAIASLSEHTDAISLRQIRTKFNTWIVFADIWTHELSDVVLNLPDKDTYDLLMAELAVINTTAKSNLIRCGRLTKEDK